MPASGSCLCGGVGFRVNGPLRAVVNCHCGQCRKWTGHHVAATAARKREFELIDPEALLRWYRSSADARRGFCSRCGSSLFWQQEASDIVAILAGSIDGPTGLETVAEIYVKDKGDYYDLRHPPLDRYEASGHGVRI